MKELGQYLAGYEVGKTHAEEGKDWMDFPPGTSEYFKDGYRKGYLEN